MNAILDIFDNRGRKTTSLKSLTTYVLGTKHVTAWEDFTIQDDNLIGHDFWWNVTTYATHPKAYYHSDLGCGYYLPSLDYDILTGTAVFTWDKTIKNELTNGDGTTRLFTAMIGVSDYDIVYGGI